MVKHFKKLFEQTFSPHLHYNRENESPLLAGDLESLGKIGKSFEGSLQQAVKLGTS